MTTTTRKAYDVRRADDSVLTACDPATGGALTMARAMELATLYGAGCYVGFAGEPQQTPAPAGGWTIVYDAETRDFGIYDPATEVQGWARSYQEAEVQRDVLKMEIAQRTSEQKKDEAAA